jgi:DNA-binding phage protein
MTRTKDFKSTVQARLREEPAFREALLTEALNCFLAGEMSVGKEILGDYIDATVGFEKLATLMAKPGHNLRRMLRPSGNPNAQNLFEILSILQTHAGLKLEVKVQPQL